VRVIERAEGLDVKERFASACCRSTLPLMRAFVALDPAIESGLQFVHPLSRLFPPFGRRLLTALYAGSVAP
jgi:hypothetical protein